MSFRASIRHHSTELDHGDLTGTQVGRDHERFASMRRNYIVSLFILEYGWAMITMASSFFIYAQSGSVAATGLIVVCLNLPSLLLPGAATSLARRFGGPTIWVMQAGVEFTITLIPVALSATGHLNTTNLLMFFLLLGILIGLCAPSAGLVRRMIAAPGQLPEFNGQAAQAVALATVIGLLAGGAVYTALGPTWVFALGALSLLPGFSLLRLTKEPVPHIDGEVERFRGVFEIRRNNPGLRAVCMFTGLSVIIASYVVTLPALAQMIAHDAKMDSSAGIQSLLQASSVVGGLFVVMAMRKAHGRVSWGQVQRICFLIAASGLLLIAVIVHRDVSALIVISLAVLLLIPIGFALTLDQSILATLMQAGAPAKSRASVLTGYALIPMIMAPLGQELIGFLADQFSVTASLIIIAVPALLLVLVGPHLNLRKALDEVSDEATD
ncbi:Major Facilitator Superfamily transporter [Actinobacteria bacterium IMCC26207]|nr:Major Facilitator Superfamily transporter [Actinobacteria bacterium IMCC26207]